MANKKYKGVYYDEKNKTYYIKPRIKNIDGSEKRPTIRGFKGQKEAYQKLQEYLVCKREQPDTLDITLSDLKDKYIDSLKGRIDENTLEGKQTKLSHFCSIDSSNQVNTYPRKKINDQNWKDIYMIWQGEMKQKKYHLNNHSDKERYFSIKYLNEIHNEICRMIDYGITNGYCRLNFAKQCGKIGTPKEVKLSNIEKSYDVIDYNEYLRLMEASKKDLKYNTYFDLSFSRGPRPGEVRAFRVCDYSKDKKQLMVNHTLSKKNKLKPPKTAASKAPIDLDDSINEKIQKLIEYWKTFSDYNDEWFLFGGPTPISSNALENAKNRYFKLANINHHIRIHDFRHSCATWLLSIDTPLKIISKILRHADINETMKTYAHLIKKDYDEGLKLINSIKLGAKTGSNNK